MKSQWVSAYVEKQFELANTGLSDAEVEKRSVEYAEGAAERAVEQAYNLKEEMIWVQF